MTDENIGYCVKCQTKKEMKDPVKVEIKMKKSGGVRHAMQGKCPVCKTTITRFIASPPKK
jgi:hypothetical protein